MGVNPLGLIEKLYSPIIKQSVNWHQALAYWVPSTLAVLIIIVLGVNVRPSLVVLLGLAIFAPLSAYVILDLRKRRHTSEYPERPKQMQGYIHSPLPKSPIASGTIHCSGVAFNLTPNHHLWLAVEAMGYVWPKDGEVVIDKGNKGRWSHVIFEDGAATAFHVALYVANEQGNQGIIDWLNAGKRNNGIYEEKKTFLGAMRLHRVEDLQRIL